MKLFITFLSFISLSAGASVACDLNKVPFGSNTEQIINKYNFDVLEVKTVGETIFAEHGKVICDELPEESLVEFKFIDNALVQVHLTTPNKSEELLRYAKSAFGKSDDTDRKKSINKTTNLALWGNESGYSVIYTSGKNTEQLDITSKNHAKLFEKIAKQRGNAIDDDLKAKGLGKYADGIAKGKASDKPVSAGDSYNPNALKNLKNKYDKAEEAYKNRQK